jgi:hypothetical protein
MPKFLGPCEARIAWGTEQTLLPNTWERQVQNRLVAHLVRLVSDGVPACVRQQVQRLAGMHTSAGEEVATAAPICSVLEPMSGRDSRVSASQAMPAGSFSFQLERQFVDVMEELSGRARQRAPVAVRIVGTFAGEDPHHIDRIVNRYLVAHR